MRFGKMPSSCLCFCKASALKGNPGWLFGWLAWLNFWLAFWLVWLGFWLAFWLAWLLAGFLACLVWLGFLAGFLAGLVCWLSGWFGLASGWLSGWFGLASGWLSGWFGLAFFFFPVFLARLAETQLLGILQAYLGVIILQPHACTQRFRLQILRRTRSFPGRTSARSLSGRIESIWETPSRERDVVPVRQAFAGSVQTLQALCGCHATWCAAGATGCARRTALSPWTACCRTWALWRAAATRGSPASICCRTWGPAEGKSQVSQVSQLSQACLNF